MNETERILQKVAKMQAENARQMKVQREDFDQRIEKQRQENVQRQAETDRQLQELSKSIKSLRQHVARSG